MDQLKRLAGAGVVLVCTALAAACTGGPSPQAAGSTTRTSPPGTVQPSSAPPSHTPSSPPSAVAPPPTDEAVLGQLSSERGTHELGPFPVTTPRIAVYVLCIGSGELTISIPGVGEFPQECSRDGSGPGIRNTFDVRYVHSVTVRGQGDDSLLWGMSVTALPGT